MREVENASANGYIREITKSEAYELLNKQTEQYLHMPADEFINAWKSGKLRDRQEDPHVARLAMLIPLAT